MGNDNETRYELKLEAKDFIDQLNQIQDILRRIDGIITQQSGKKYAIDVQIKNKDFQRVFENLEKIMSRTGDDAAKIGASIERVFGRSKAIDRATKAIDDYENAVKVSGQRVKKSAENASEAITSVYKKNTDNIITFINRADSSAKRFSQNVSSTFSKAVREIKKDLDSLGIDTSNMSAKDLIKFQQELNKQYDRRKTSQDLTKTFREGWEDTLNSVGEKMLATEDRLSGVRERNINKQTELYEKQMLKIQSDLDAREEARLDKETQRRTRMALYSQNVSEASRLLRAQVSESNTPTETKLLSQYNRAIQRIRGIYQAAVVHGRVENPETILAGLAELQQRSLALNNYRLSEQMGITELDDKLKNAVKRLDEFGTRWNKISSVIQNSVQAFSSIQSFAQRITSTLTNLARNVLTRISSQVSSLVRQSTEAFQSLEVSMIGFRNFFGEQQADRLYQRVKAIAAEAPGLSTTDLADYIKQIAPVSNGDANLALNASLGMLKTIQYGGANGSSEMEYVIKNIRDVLSKGKATAIDIRQFNRAMPILEKVLDSVGQSQLLKDGVLTIDKNNVDTILSAFAALNTSEQSEVANIFSQMNKTLAGQWEQFTEQFTTNLMEMLRGSGIYGGVQNILMQVNNGAYVEDVLARLQNSIAKFINGINWFKVQRIATEVWDGLKIIWGGITDAVEGIAEVVGKTKSGSVIKSFATWIADIIRGMGDGITQVIKFVQNLEKSGILNMLSRIIGWFGSSGAILTKFLGTLTSHVSNIIGNIAQLVARYSKINIQSKLGTLNSQLNAIPVTARSQIASSTDLLNGTGVAQTEVGAIQSLSSMVNAHLMKIEANQTGGSTLGKVATAVNNGKRYVWTDDFDGAGHGAIGTWNKRTNSYDWSGWSNNKAGYAEYQKLTTQNFLQGSNIAALQKIGDNKYVNRTLKWMKSAGTTILSYAQKLLGNLMKGGIALTVTEGITGIMDSLDMFGDATVYISGVVKSAGYAIAGALVGKTFGGISGGVVGALIGLGAGIASVINTIKEKEKDLANTKITEALDDAEQAMYDQTVALLRQYGFNVDEESIVGAGALQQLAYYIKSTPVANRSTEEAVKYYNEAYKMLSIGYALKSFSESTGYNALGGNEIDLSNTDAAYFKQLAEMVREYGLAEGNGYYYGEGINGRSYYRDENLTEQISAEELLKNAFPNGVTDEQAKSLLEKANQLSEDYGKSTTEKFQELMTNNQEFKTALNNIDENVAAILTTIAANTGKGLSDENTERVYGKEARTAAEKYQERYQNIGNDIGTWFKSGGIFSPIADWIGNPTANTQDNYDFDKIYPKIMQERESAVRENDSARVAWLDEWANTLIDKILNDEDMDEMAYMYWVKKMLNQYNKEFSRSLTFAKGGLTPSSAFSSIGVDTVPAMLSPGEFVMKPSAVKKTGLGVMYALNRGDLGAAARTLSQQVNNRTWNRNDSSTINNRITNNNTNNFRIFNRSNSARMNGYFSLANRLSF